MFHFYTHFSGDIEMTILAIFSVLWHIKQIRQIHWTKQHRSQNLMIITLFRIFYKFTVFLLSLSLLSQIKDCKTNPKENSPQTCPNCKPTSLLFNVGKIRGILKNNRRIRFLLEHEVSKLLLPSEMKP